MSDNEKLDVEDFARDYAEGLGGSHPIGKRVINGLMDIIDSLKGERSALVDEVERLRAEMAKLKDQVWIYGAHHAYCPLEQRVKGAGCECGFNALFGEYVPPIAAALSPSRDGSPTGNWQDDENRRKGLPDLPSRDGSP